MSNFNKVTLTRVSYIEFYVELFKITDYILLLAKTMLLIRIHTLNLYIKGLNITYEITKSQTTFSYLRGQHPSQVGTAGTPTHSAVRAASTGRCRVLLCTTSPLLMVKENYRLGVILQAKNNTTAEYITALNCFALQQFPLANDGSLAEQQ